MFFPLASVTYVSLAVILLCPEKNILRLTLILNVNILGTMSVYNMDIKIPVNSH